MIRLADMGVIGSLFGFNTKKLPTFCFFAKARRRLKNNLYNRFEENN